MKRLLVSVSFAAMLMLGGMSVYAQAPQDGEKATATEQVRKLRGKLMYKKGQIRKLEEATVAVNAEVKAKVEKLEQERRAVYVAVEDTLVKLYNEQDALDAEIKKLLPLAQEEKAKAKEAKK